MGLTDMVEIATTTSNIKANKKMSIQVSLDGLSFCILDKERQEIEYLKSFDFEKQLDPIKVLSRIELIIEEESILQQPVQEASLFFTNTLFTLVPSNLFDEEQAVSFLKFNTKILKTDFIAHDEINNELVNVYIPYANIINYFFDMFGEFEYRHSLSILIDSLLKIKSSEKPKVYLHTHLYHYELVVIQNSKLIFANSFEFDTKEDFIYYLLFTLEQLELDPKEVELILLGDIKKDSEEYNIAYRYITNISFLDVFHTFSFSEEAKPKYPLADYLTIKSLS